MPDGYITDPEQLKAMAQGMVDTNEQLQDNGRKLAQAVDSVQSAWSGAAAVAFTNLMTTYGNDFKALNEALFAMAEQVTGTSVDYTRQEEEASTDMSLIMQTLGDG
jgi:WXG100 family type VII secretion target